MKRSLFALSLVVALAAALVSPASSAPKQASEYTIVEEALPFEALPDATAYFGTFDQAGYRIEVPTDWNGELVMWAHGYAGTGAELFVQNPPDALRTYFVENGYAWAASSYAKNDYNVLDPARETRRLAGNFFRLTNEGNPTQRYLAGYSMGGNITAYSAERYGDYYAGTMPMCGVMADLDLFDYFADINLAAQELGGAGSFPVDPVQWIGSDVPTIKSNLEAVEGGWPLALNEDGQNYKNLVEQASGGDRPNFDEGWFFWNSIAEDFLFGTAIDSGTVAVRGDYLQTTDSVYQFDADPALSPEEVAFNESIQRLDRDNIRLKDRRGIPENTGDIEAPMLAMHNLGDLFVPYFNEIEYAERVAASGNSDLLVQRAIRGAQHCDFTDAELVQGFADLVNWVDNGVKPEGDAILDPAAVADPSYGCKFTIGDHLFGTPCGVEAMS